MMTKSSRPANDDGCPREALIAVEAVLVMLEQLAVNPDAKRVISHIKIIETIAQTAASALRGAASA